jgi:hypothetical protein
LQRALSAQLEQLATTAQVLVTTHSPVIIDAPDIRKICRLQRDPDGLDYKWHPPEISDKAAGQLRRHCDVKNSEIVFAKKAVFCEGISDAGAISELLSLIDRQHGVSVVSMGGADIAEQFVKLARRFDIDFLVVLDKDKVTSERRTLKKVAAALDLSLTPAEEGTLDQLRQQQCATLAHAHRVRDDAQAIVGGRRVYCLGTDIEGAVALSYAKTAVLSILGPDELAHLSQDVVTELRNLNGARYRSRLNRLVGSKGWNNDAADESRKLKPHVPKAVVGTLGRPRANSDLGALMTALQAFVSV